MKEAERIFEEIDDDEYEQIQDSRRNDDFIVDDEGYGYRDHGGEIWEVDEEEEGNGKPKNAKKRKLDVSEMFSLLSVQPNEQHITNFMMPQSALGKKKPTTASGMTIKQKPKVSEEQSRDIMNNLFSELDKKDNEELEDISSAAVIAELNKPIALNKQDQLYNKYNITLGGGSAQSNEDLPSEKAIMGPPANTQ